MKAISIRQPWAWLIANGFKDVENREWNTRFRGRVLIHAGKTLRKADYEIAVDFAARLGVTVPLRSDLKMGGIVGVATITDCVRAYDSPWFVGKHGFVLREPRVLPFIPCRGQLGFFDVDKQVARQLREWWAENQKEIADG